MHIKISDFGSATILHKVENDAPGKTIDISNGIAMCIIGTLFSS